MTENSNSIVIELIMNELQCKLKCDDLFLLIKIPYPLLTMLIIGA